MPAQSNRCTMALQRLPSSLITVCLSDRVARMCGPSIKEASAVHVELQIAQAHQASSRTVSSGVHFSRSCGNTPSLYGNVTHARLVLW